MEVGECPNTMQETDSEYEGTFTKFYAFLHIFENEKRIMGLSCLHYWHIRPLHQSNRFGPNLKGSFFRTHGSYSFNLNPKRLGYACH